MNSPGELMARWQNVSKRTPNRLICLTIPTGCQRSVDGGGACLRALGLLHLVVAGWMAFRGKSGMPTPPHVVFATFFSPEKLETQRSN